MQIQNFFFSKIYLAGMVLILGGVCFVPEVFAGFEWTPPAEIEKLEPERPQAPVAPLSPMPTPQDDTSKIDGYDNENSLTEEIFRPVPSSIHAEKLNTEEPLMLVPPAPKNSSLPQKSLSVPVEKDRKQVFFEGRPLRRKKPHMTDFSKNRPVTEMPQTQESFHSRAKHKTGNRAVLKPESSYPVIDLYPMEKDSFETKTGSSPTVTANDTAGSRIAGTGNEIPFYRQAVGFGEDIPLALALNQIVPPDYPYSFSENVDPGIRINWKGGRPWNIVLADALEPYGYDISINDKRVLVHKNAPSPLSGMHASPKEEKKRKPGQPQNLMPMPLAPDFPDVSQESNNYSAKNPADNIPDYLLRRPAGKTSVPEPYTNVQPEFSSISSEPPPADPWEVASTSDFAPDPDKPVIKDPFSIVTADLENAAHTGHEEENVWNAEAGDRLKNILADWSSRAGVQLHWASRYDYPLQSDVAVDGNFEEAVETLLTGLMEANPRPVGRLHPNYPKGPPVLIIETHRVMD